MTTTETTTGTFPRATRRLAWGCSDCGGSWSRKSEIPEKCQPYTSGVKWNDNYDRYEWDGREL